MHLSKEDALMRQAIKVGSGDIVAEWLQVPARIVRMNIENIYW